MCRLVSCWLLLSVPLAAADSIVLENDKIRLEVDSQHGTLERLVDKTSSVDLRSDPLTADNYRLLVPLPDAPQNYILGRHQRLSYSQLLPNRMVLRWDSPLTDQVGREYDIGVQMTVDLVESSLVFEFQLENDSPHVVQEVWYPGLGGLFHLRPADTREPSTLQPPPHQRPLTSPFGQSTIGYPLSNMPFISLDNRALGRGLYLAAHDPIARFKAIHLLEVMTGNEPNLLAYIVHFPHVQPGGSFRGSPAVVQFHGGDWIDAGRSIYRPWFIRTFGLSQPEHDWIREHSFFQMIMVMLPEGNINYTLKQIPQLARDGLKYGVRSLQIAGWQRGGHDNGYPYYEPDPRLGTWQDLADAVRKCHEMGVRVYFFVNIHVNNLDTEWYQRELKNIDYLNRQAERYMVAGWGMGTLASRMGHTAPLMTTGDCLDPVLHDRLVEYFRRLAEAGADGIHVDKLYPGLINFNPRTTLSPDASPWEGTIRTLENIRRECRAISPDFAFSIETTWDRSLSFGASTWWGGNMSAAKQIFPELVETVGLYQPYDFAGVNDAVRNGYAVMVAPYHFNRSMDTPAWRGLSEYIREVKRIRDDLADWIYFGELLGSQHIEWDDKTQAEPPHYTTFRNRKNGKLACVMTHTGAESKTYTLTNLDDQTIDQIQIYRPFHATETATLPAAIDLEPEQLAIIVQP